MGVKTGQTFGFLAAGAAVEVFEFTAAALRVEASGRAVVVVFALAAALDEALAVTPERVFGLSGETGVLRLRVFGATVWTLNSVVAGLRATAGSLLFRSMFENFTFTPYE